MNKTSLISIVLPCYNAERTLKSTLDSIANQLYKDFELIFIDDGSQDASLKIAKEFLSKSSINMKIITRENKGFLKSLDEGIKNSNGDYIARIDADDMWEQDHLELIMREFENNMSLVLVGSNAKYINENMEDIGMSDQANSNNAVMKYMLQDSPFIHSSVVFKKEAYKKTSGYLIGEDDGSKHIADYNLWFELSKYGQCINISNQTVLYRILENSMSRQMDRCINYSARLSVMQKVYRFHKKFYFYFFLQNIKVKLRIFQHCFFRSFIK